MYEVEITPSAIGAFPERFRQRPGVIRSRDPMLSSSGIGPSAREVLRTISQSCYGEGSTFHRLRELDAKICTLGLGLHWATFRHHIEEAAAVPFRFLKSFHGVVREEGCATRETWNYFAAPLLECCQPMGLPLEHRARMEGLVAVADVGRGQIMVTGAREYFGFGLQELRRDPWLTAKGPPCDLDELVRREDARVAGRKPMVSVDAGLSMHDMLDAVWRFPRDLVSDGYDAALASLARQVPTTIHEYPSGSDCGTSIAPEKWTCREASLETLDGRRVLTYADSPLHVASYSQPFDGVVSREELFEHLDVHPVLDEATPYRDLSREGAWGLCCSRRLKDTLTDDRYRVRIDAAFSFGTLKIAEVVAPGRRDAGVVFCAHLDHSAQANDGLSGCVVGIEVMRQLACRQKPRFTYRLLIVPGAVGFGAFFRHHQRLFSNIHGSLFLDILGLDRPLRLQHSSDQGSAFGRCCEHALRSEDPSLRVDVCLDAGMSMHSRFSALDTRMPWVSLSRVERRPGQTECLFNEHHSDRDTTALVSTARLEAASRAVLAIVDSWECANGDSGGRIIDG